MVTTATLTKRWTIIGSDGEETLTDFARAVRQGLTGTPKSLPCRFIYDAEGSVLFEQICHLPEYYVARSEDEILHRNAQGIADAVDDEVVIVELGSGSSRKTRHLIEEFIRRQGLLRYVPIDISRPALEESASSLLDDYPMLRITALACEYRQGLRSLRNRFSRPKLILWLGSNVGNYSREDAVRFLHLVRSNMGPDDRLLMGIDLRKEKAVLERAYDDSFGITARFNLNLLARINRDLGGDADLRRFHHRAVYDEREGVVRMFLVSRGRQILTIPSLNLQVPFEAREKIHTEESYKYSREEILALAGHSGFILTNQWFDDGDRFSVNLMKPRSR